MKDSGIIMQSLIIKRAHRGSDFRATANMSALSSGNEDVTKGPDALPGLFTDATLYDRYLNAHRYESSNNKSEVALKGFADLVAGDLNSSEKAITSRLAKLAVAGDSFADPDVFAGSELTSESDSETEVLSVTSNNKELEESSVPSSSSALEELDLAPNEIVDLLIQEFGPLAAEGEEERLLTGEDGAWVHHVVILVCVCLSACFYCWYSHVLMLQGTLHLTTHRLTFHASLLSSRPDLSPNQQVIKAGPVTIHRKGWHKKLKVWMELGHDSLTSYASSSDEDRIRPIHTVLCMCQVHDISSDLFLICSIQIQTSSGFFPLIRNALEWCNLCSQMNLRQKGI